MKNLKKLSKISLLALGATSLTLNSFSESNAQIIQAQTTHNLNLRSGASTNNSIILTLKKGTTVEVIESLGVWSKVKHKNHIGYVSSQYLKKNINQDNSSNNENNDQSDKIKLMECGTELLNIRFGPSTSEKIIGTLKKGDKVEILYEVNNSWARIKFNGGHGYVSMQYLTEINSNNITNKPTVMYCNTSTLNIRKGPSTTDLIVGSLKINDKVEVIGKLNNGWSKIKFNNSFAYVSSQYLSSKSSSSNNSTANYMKCKVDLLNVRSGPSSSEKIIGKLEKDDMVEVMYHVSTGWTKIKYARGYAYVSTNYLTTV